LFARATAIAAVLSTLSCLAAVSAAEPRPEISAPVLFSRKFFFVGGDYAEKDGQRFMHGQMYVEALSPQRIKHRYPLVLIHGGAQTATNWLTTPDGRPGWADYFLSRGYQVYLVDQPARGRSPWQPEIDGPIKTYPTRDLERRFTAPEAYDLWPQAKLHTQWPGDGPNKGRAGDPIFDQFYASQIGFLASNAETQTLMQKAGAALLDRIGPAVLLTHSQSGAFGWLIADARPKLVKGIAAVEPLGPPFQDEVSGTGKARAWGLTDIPMSYDPPAAAPGDLQVERQANPDSSDVVACWQQKAPARTLPHLQGIPILIEAGEASYHTLYDHCTSLYLTEAGVKHDFIRLASRGIHGNGHMQMLEKNNLQIAQLLDEWISSHVK
jgi:pimeloyl-ACP methyl ester carboxylesterase